MRKEAFLPAIVYLFLILFLTGLVTNKYIGEAYLHLFLFFGFIFSIFVKLDQKTFQDNEEKLIRFSVFLLLSSLLISFFQQNAGVSRLAVVADDLSKTLIVVLTFSVLYWLKPKSYSWLIASVTLASFIAGMITLYDMHTGLGRAHRVYGAPVYFGDLSMLLGILSLVFSAVFYGKNWYLFVLVLVSGICGIFASLYSGTRGGWIVLLTLPFLLFLIQDKPLRNRLLWGILLVFTLGVIILVVVENPVKLRLIQAYGDVNSIVEGGSYIHSSLGGRFELFKVAVSAFLSNPVFGIGLGEFYKYKLDYIQSYPETAAIGWFKHPHNDYLYILSGLGIVGFSLYAFFIIWLWKMFKSTFLEGAKEARILGFSGLVVLVSFMDFALSSSFWSSSLGHGAFYFLVTALFFHIQRISLGKNEGRWG